MEKIMKVTDNRTIDYKVTDNKCARLKVTDN